MKRSRRFFNLSLQCAAGFASCAVLAAAERNAAVPVVVAPPPVTTEKAGDAAAVQDARPARLSAGLDEILKLNKSGVEESVVLAFIQSSPIPYYPTAQEIVVLRERGISAPVLTALLQHGAEVRQRSAEAAAAAETTPPAPHVDSPPSVPEPVRVDSGSVVYTASSPTVIYSGYPSYSYSSSYYPYYGYYGGCYPGISLGIGFGFGGYYGGHHGGHVSTVHGSGGGTVHGHR